MVNPAILEIYSNINILDGISLKHQALYRCRKLSQVTDQPVRFELGDWDIGISKFNADHRDAGAARDADIRTGVADHDRRAELPAGARDRLAPERRSRLPHAQRG